MRFGPKPHPWSCGIDLHARTIGVCILTQEGDIRVHRNRPASPDALLKVMAPSREEIVVAVECRLTWYWVADLGVQEGSPCGLGHARSMKASHGGKAKHDKYEERLHQGLRYQTPAAMYLQPGGASS